MTEPGGPAPLDPKLLLTTLAKHDVAYVMIGALAARMQGFPRLTADMDITPQFSDDNLDRLAGALEELDARIYTDAVPAGLPYDWAGSALVRATIWNLATRGGRLDIAFEPAGSTGFAELVERAVRFEAFGVEFFVAHLSDILRSKEAAGRPQDLQDAEILREMLSSAGTGPDD